MVNAKPLKPKSIALLTKFFDFHQLLVTYSISNVWQLQATILIVSTFFGWILNLFCFQCRWGKQLWHLHLGKHQVQRVPGINCKVSIFHWISSKELGRYSTSYFGLYATIKQHIYGRWSPWSKAWSILNIAKTYWAVFPSSLSVFWILPKLIFVFPSFRGASPTSSTRLEVLPYLQHLGERRTTKR